MVFSRKGSKPTRIRGWVACAFLVAFGLSLPAEAKKPPAQKAATAKPKAANKRKPRLATANRKAKAKANRKAKAKANRKAKAKANRKAKAKRATVQTKAKANRAGAAKATKTKRKRSKAKSAAKRRAKTRKARRIARKKRRGRRRASRPKPKPRLAGSKPGKANSAARQVVQGIFPNRATAGATESEELKALREADGLLFPRSKASAVRSWRRSPRKLTKRLRTRSNGLPASSDATSGSAAAKTTASPAAKGSEAWLAQLKKPDFPVRFAPAVVKYLKYYKNTKRGRRLARAFVRKSGRYANALHTLLDKHKLPRDLLWLAMIESGFNATIHSHAGAAGLWQFMPATARIYGLTVTKRIDERLDPERASAAALMHLSDLHKRFGSWELAFAAYNMGYGGVLHAIRKFNTNSFWKLRKLEAGLPYETSLYVPKIMALAIVANNCSVFGCAQVTPEPARPFGAQQQDRLAVAPGVTLKRIAKAAKLKVEQVKELNPQLLGSRLPPLQTHPLQKRRRGSWYVYLPTGNAKKAKSRVRSTGMSPYLQSYRVRHGESLEHVALRFGTSSARLQYLNDLHPLQAPRPGQHLFVPAGRKALDDASVFAKRYPRQKPIAVVAENPAQPQQGALHFYEAVLGDRVADVAKACGVHPSDLARWNHVDEQANLQTGMRLRVFLEANGPRPTAVLIPAAKVLKVRRNSTAFYSRFLYGRRRMKVRVKAGDTWKKLARRYGLSVGMLERINARSRYRKPVVGSTVTVYARRWPNTSKATAAPNQATAKRQSGKASR